MGDEIADLIGVVNKDRTAVVIEQLLAVVRLQHQALVEVRPLLHAATVDVAEALEGTGVPVPFANELWLIDSALALAGGLIDHVDELHVDGLSR